MLIENLFGHGPKRQLVELSYRERSPLTAVLEANRGRWIHFSQIPKLGVNPKKIHDDPAGIYFYPVDFLLSDFHRLEDGSQFGLSWPYFFICDIDLSTKGLTLSKTSMSDVEALAAQNGWLPILDAYKNADEAERREMTTSFKDITSPGHLLWSLLDQQQKNRKITWNRALKGLSYIRDDGNGIIYNYEPDQIVVFDPRILKNVTLHNNKGGEELQGHRTDKKEAWTHGLKMLFEKLKSDIGGDLVWKDKMPEYHLDKDGCVFRFYFAASSQKVYCEFKHGRAKDHHSISIRNETAANLLQTFKSWIDEATGRTEDLHWTPALSEDDARLVLQHMTFTSSQDLKIETEIENGRNEAMYITADAKNAKIRALPVETRSFLSIKPDAVDQSITCEIGGRRLLSISSTPIDPNDIPGSMKKLADALETTLRGRIKYIGPEARSFSRSKFYYNDDWQAFLGWYVLNCGLSLDGEFVYRFDAEIRAYHAYENKRSLFKEIAQVAKDL